MKKIAILQSNYIPWKGYFDIISKVDEFIFYDEVQYTKNDWRNRNQIVTPNGLLWLTIPVKHQSLYQKINETEVVNDIWRKKHLGSLTQFYKKAPFYNSYIDIIREIYDSCTFMRISDINMHFIKSLNKLLNIETKLSISENYGMVEGKTERLVDLVLKAKGSEYISGPAAKTYIDKNLFAEAGIKLTWMDYSQYSAYPQLSGDFRHGVSIVDTIFNTGSEVRNYIN